MTDPHDETGGMSDIYAIDMTAIDLREKLAHIDRMLADHDRKCQEIRFAP